MQNNIQYGLIKKKICFDATDKLHAELKIRLHYDEIKIKEFFNSVVQGYIDQDEHIVSFIEEQKEKKRVSMAKRKRIKNMSTKRKDTINKFGLDKSDIENIFDILEKESLEL
jgi:hypothetical protein